MKVIGEGGIKKEWMSIWQRHRCVYVRLCVHICSERLTSVQAFYQFLEGSLLHSHALRGPSIFKALKVKRFFPKTSLYVCWTKCIILLKCLLVCFFFQQKDFTKHFLTLLFFSFNAFNEEAIFFNAF